MSVGSLQNYIMYAIQKECSSGLILKIHLIKKIVSLGIKKIPVMSDLFLKFKVEVASWVGYEIQLCFTWFQRLAWIGNSKSGNPPRHAKLICDIF